MDLKTAESKVDVKTEENKVDAKTEENKVDAKTAAKEADVTAAKGADAKTEESKVDGQTAAKEAEAKTAASKVEVVAEPDDNVVKTVATPPKRSRPQRKKLEGKRGPRRISINIEVIVGWEFLTLKCERVLSAPVWS